MSMHVVRRTPRVAFVLAAAAMLAAPNMATAAAPATTASSASVLAAVGQATPTALGPGTPSTNHAVYAQPLRSLDPDALRAAKLRAAAIASRSSRGP